MLALLSLLPAQGLDKAVLFIGWRAEPETGGLFQALNAGIYRKYGLDVEIRIGSPQSNAEMFLAMNKVDFVGGTTSTAINALAQNIPDVTIAALFQKSPRVLIAHAGVGNDTLPAMKGKPIWLGAQARATVWPFLRMRYGFTDDQLHPYNFNEAPFLANPLAVQEGYITEEPYTLRKLGIADKVFLLSDAGYEEYGATLITTREKIEKRPDFVRRFVNASIEGWYGYLYGDPTPGNAFIKANTPELSDDQIAYAIKVMRDSGIVDSGDSKQLGIGAMSAARWSGFYQMLVQAGLAPAGLDVSRAYTLQFVNQKVGL